MMISKIALAKGDRREIANLWLFSLGKFISLLGTAIYTFAMSLYVLKETGSGLSFATNLALGIIPVVLVSPFAGVLADKLNRKYLVVVMDLLNGVLMIGLFYLSTTQGISLPMIYITTFIMTVFSTIFSTSLEAGKPNIVSEKKLMMINSVSKIMDSMSAILGPMIGGIIYAFVDIKLFVFINGISFILSGISEGFIDFDYNRQLKANSTNGSIIDDVKDGFSYLSNHSRIKSLLFLFIIINFFTNLSIMVPLPYIINDVLKLKTEYYGIIQSTFPIGIILGAVMVKKVSEGTSYNKLLIRMAMILALCMVILGLPLLLKIRLTDANYLIYYSIVVGALGVMVAFIDIPIAYLLQKGIEDQYRGRVLSLFMSIVKIVAPIALLISGLFINQIDPWVLPIAGGILLGLSLMVYKRRKGVPIE